MVRYYFVCTIYAAWVGHVLDDNERLYLNNLCPEETSNINTVLNIITFIAETYLTSKRFEWISLHRFSQKVCHPWIIQKKPRRVGIISSQQRYKFRYFCSGCLLRPGQLFYLAPYVHPHTHLYPHLLTNINGATNVLHPPTTIHPVLYSMVRFYSANMTHRCFKSYFMAAIKPVRFCFGKSERGHKSSCVYLVCIWNAVRLSTVTH